MPDKLPQLNARQIIRALRRDGWEMKRQTGSHRHFRHPTKPGLVTVADHGAHDIPLSTIRSILKQANLTEDELRDLL